MKTLQVATTLLILFSVSTYAYCQLWEQYADSAKVYDNKKNTDIAIEFYEKAKEELKKDSARKNIFYAGICHSLADLYDNKNKYDTAESLYIEVKQIRETLFGKENIDYANSCNGLGLLYMDMRQYKS